MRLFTCPNCNQIVHFENASCGACGTLIGYDPSANAMKAISDEAPLCANATHGACNWIAENEPLCRACRHNETIPDISVPANLERWQTIERAKKRLFYSLIRFGLPLITKTEDPNRGLAFDFLADTDDEKPVMTGHAAGVITIALVEADDAEREKRRSAMGEPYRTLLGHFRHEVAHYYWDILVADSKWIEQVRTVFGDEREDYAEALKAHYANGAPPDWEQRFVSAYATSHPWEDFAESWAHLFHITDTLETARNFGVAIAPRRDRSGDLSAEVDFSPYHPDDIEEVVDSWVAVSVMLNEMNRSMGLADAYPFVLSEAIVKKLGLIGRIIGNR